MRDPDAVAFDPKTGEADPRGWVAPHRVKEALVRAVVAAPTLSPAALKTMLALVDRADAATGVAWPGRSCIAKDAALSERSVARGLQELRAAGWVQVLAESDGVSTVRHMPAWGRGIARRKHTTRESRQGAGVSPVPEMAPVPSPSPVPEPSPVPNPAATGDKTGGRRVTATSPKEKSFKKGTLGRKVDPGADATPTAPPDDGGRRQAILALMRIRPGAQHDIRRVAGIALPRFKRWRAGHDIFNEHDRARLDRAIHEIANAHGVRL